MRILLIILIGICCIAKNTAQITYVAADATGADDGSSWQDAYTELWNALEHAKNGDSLFIKKGNYKTKKVGDYGPSMEIPSGVKLFGGFEGDETSLTERPSTLEHSEVSSYYKVFLCIDTDSTTLIDGLYIRDNWTLPFPNEGGQCNIDNKEHICFGGGVFIGTWDSTKTACLKINNCIFESNFAPDAGGALALYCPTGKSGLWVKNTVFRKNRTNLGHGGGSGGAIFLSAGGSANHYGFFFEDCVFEENRAEWRGSVHTAQGDWDVEFKNCIFLNNRAQRMAAAISKGSYPNSRMMRITDCVFLNNKTEPSRFWPGEGGAIFGERIQIDRCLIKGSTAFRGGAIMGTDLFISNTSFLDNYAGWDGGAVYHLSYGNEDNMKRHVYHNCTFAGNRADSTCGAIRGSLISLDTFINCIFYENSAGKEGQNIHYWNTIRAGYYADNNYFDVTDTLDAIYEFFVNRDSAFFGVNNILKLENAGLGWDPQGWLRPGDCSPLIGQGNPYLHYDLDMSRNERPTDRPTTLGALEPMPWVYDWRSEDADCHGYMSGKVWHDGEHILGPVLFSETGGNKGYDTLFLDKGVYMITATDQAGCKDSTTLYIDGHEEIIIIDSLLHPSGESQYDGRIEVLNIDGEYPPFQLSWSNGFSGMINEGLAVGTYHLSITDAYGCEVVRVYSLSYTSSTTSEDIQDIQIWPNPANEYLNISSGVAIKSFRITDISGRVMMQSGQVNQTSIGVNIHQLPQGMYLIWITTTDGYLPVCFKLIKG
jgi:hypothetical protein